MEQYPKSKFSPEEIAEWRKNNADMIKAALPSFEIAPDGTLMKHNEKGELDTEDKEFISEERKGMGI